MAHLSDRSSYGRVGARRSIGDFDGGGMALNRVIWPAQLREVVSSHVK